MTLRQRLAARGIPVPVITTRGAIYTKDEITIGAAGELIYVNLPERIVCYTYPELDLKYISARYFPDENYHCVSFGTAFIEELIADAIGHVDEFAEFDFDLFVGTGRLEEDSCAVPYKGKLGIHFIQPIVWTDLFCERADYAREHPHYFHQLSDKLALVRALPQPIAEEILPHAVFFTAVSDLEYVLGKLRKVCARVDYAADTKELLARWPAVIRMRAEYNGRDVDIAWSPHDRYIFVNGRETYCFSAKCIKNALDSVPFS